MKVAQLLSLRGPWEHQVCRDTDYLHHRSYGSIRVFIRASYSWRLEGLFGQSFSIAPPIQALRGLPCLGSFSVVPCVRHIEGPYSVDGVGPWILLLDGVLLCRLVDQALKGVPWVGSYSVVQCIRRLMDQPLYFSAANAGKSGTRGYGDGPTPYM